MASLRPLASTVRIPIENFAEFERELGAEIRRAVFAKAMPKIGRAVQQLLQDETVERGIFNTGKFAKSWRVQTSDVPSSIRVINKRPYASVIEYGRRPGATMPPVRVIKRWVISKLGVPREEANAVAWAIARKIHLYGIPARPIVRNPEVREKIQKIVVDEVLSRLADVADRVARQKGR